MRTKSGCFVYRALEGIGIRYTPSTKDSYRTERSVSRGDRLSVDLILYDESTSTDGPFLRLSDGSGWLFEKVSNDVVMEQETVETGLWSFYVGNYNTGIGLRNHPMDQLKNENQGLVLKQVPKALRLLPPMHRVFCDRKLQDKKTGVCFYRLQQEGECGSYPSWVFDKRMTSASGKKKSFDVILHPDNHIQSGLFAFRVGSSYDALNIRSGATTSDNARTPWSVEKNELVVCDIILDSPLAKRGDGPFVRLSDGTGWLFQNKGGEKMMKEVKMEKGRWEFRITNKDGIQLRKQPIDNTKSRYSTIYPNKSTVECDLRIPAKSSSYPNFYRVEGKKGWVFDKRGDKRMMQMISGHTYDEDDTPHQINGNDEEWTPEFVRGIAAATMRGIEVMFYNPQSRVISFRHPEGARINVYYTTRTIGTALEHNSHQGGTQLFRRNCTQEELIEIMHNPRVHTGRGYYKAENQPSGGIQRIQMSLNQDVNIEEDFRNRLKDLEGDMRDLTKKRAALWESISSHDSARLKKSKAMHKRTENHEEVIEAEIEAKATAKQEVKRRKERTCNHCGREFVNPAAVRNHIQDVHSEPTCEVCDKSFMTQTALNQHIEATGHY